jgi:hypothetical protein
MDMKSFVEKKREDEKEEGKQGAHYPFDCLHLDLNG